MVKGLGLGVYGVGSIQDFVFGVWGFRGEFSGLP